MSELLLGYDVREACLQPYDLCVWSAERRTTYLIDPKAEQPLSVDTLLWPSLFDTGQGAAWHKDGRKRAGLSEPILPPWPGDYLHGGLATCGYSAPERVAAVRLFAGLLNSHHLFERSEDANDCCKCTDQRVPEHSPFHEYGLWQSSVS